MNNLYIEARLQTIKDIASASCADIKDADNIASFCDEIYDAIPKLDKIVEELYEERTEILLSNDYECEIINYCLDNFDNAIEIVKAGEKNE